jgi:hypothetical protein
MEAEDFESAFAGQLMDMLHKRATNHLIQHAVKGCTMKTLEPVTTTPVVSSQTVLQCARKHGNIITAHLSTSEPNLPQN